mgnify:FL=1|jgi:glycosyltransferase involved in cell wall biosynthesis
MKPHITMLTTFYPPYNFGGDGIGVQRLSTALAKYGFDITIVHNADAYLMQAKKEPPPAPPPPEGIRVVSLTSDLGTTASLITHQTGRPLAHHSQLKQLLSPETTDVTWFHNVSLVGGPGLLSYGAGLKIYEAHEHWLVCPSHVLWRFDRELCDSRQCLKCVLSYKRPPQMWRYTGYLDRQAREVDLFIAKSEFSRAKHREFGFKQDMKVAPYFLPDANAEDIAAGPAHDKPFFLFVGRLEKIKGVQDIIPTFAGETGTDLVIIGDGEYAATLREQAKGMPRVKFLGRKPPESLPPFYRDALALITPSLCFETFGIVLIEAFRLGLPVIARRLGPFPEIIEKARAGLLFETEAELREAIGALEKDSHRRAEMSRTAKQSFVTHWSEAAVMRRYFKLLEDAARRKGLSQLADIFKERSLS